ncbi:unnamed protein product [Gongylonema pulchrum]|uniref:DUF4005 domain-containing protein n=1 Tax=Gongylonema pulchrum TaxID=637853 RepID=A0A183E071_9BILA|nr:unnamed protein product [Gongylonema pulchrum]
MMAAVEGIAGYRGQYWFTEHYVKPYLMSNAKSGADRLVDYHEHIQVKEAVRHLKVHGSFVGLATTQSKANLQQMEASHLVSDNAYVESGLTGDTLKPNDTGAKMPRNESISVFLREKFDQLNSVSHKPVSFGVYSRHLLDVDNTPRAVFRRQDALHNSNTFDALDNDAYHMTYPYCKNARIRRQTTHGGTATERIDMLPKKSTASVRSNSNSEALTLNIDASKPRFLITSEADSDTPPSAPRHLTRMTAESDSQESMFHNVFLDL